MSKRILLLAVISMAAFIIACQPNPTQIHSTVQPRDNRQATNHSGANHSTAHGDSTNHEMSNANAMTSNNANHQTMNNAVNHSERKTESRSNTGR